MSEGDLWMMGEAKEVVSDVGMEWEDVVEVKVRRMEWKGWWELKVRVRVSEEEERVVRRVVQW